jgi:hypothetical protein
LDDSKKGEEMYYKKSEKGQALIVITFAIIGLIGITGIAVDGGMAYADHRHAQNAADSAAYAAALDHVRNPTLGISHLTTVAQSIASSNGYTNNENTTISLTTASVPSYGCPSNTNPADNVDITVKIESKINTSFATIVGIGKVNNTVTATTRACGIYVAPLYGGAAITSLSPDTTKCAFDSDTGSATWIITGGGISSQGCAVGRNNVTLDPDYCVSAVGAISGFSSTCPGNTSYGKAYTDKITPPNPCDNTPGDVGVFPPDPSGTDVNYSDGIYCISDFGQYDKKNINLTNATLYVTDTAFNLNFTGGGGFSGTPTQDGIYKNYYLIVAPNTAKPCTDFNDQNGVQSIRYAGNGNGTLQGTVLAPTACVDLRGNGDAAAAYNSQIIGYTVTSNGSATVKIDFNSSQNHQEPVAPTIKLLQ